MNNSNIRDKPTHEAVKQDNAKNPPQHGTPKKGLEYTRKSPQLAVLPSPSINSISINQDPQIKYYNVHDPPHPTDNTEEDGEDNEEQSVTNNDNDDSNYEDQEDTPPIHPSAMNATFPFPVFNTMERFDIFQV